MKRQELFDHCKDQWGLDSQILMLAEECGELSVATLHLLRDLKPKKESMEKFIEEIADVQLMIDEMVHYFGLKDELKAVTKEKIIRLERILRGETL